MPLSKLEKVDKWDFHAASLAYFESLHVVVGVEILGVFQRRRLQGWQQSSKDRKYVMGDGLPVFLEFGMVGSLDPPPKGSTPWPLQGPMGAQCPKARRAKETVIKESRHSHHSITAFVRCKIKMISILNARGAGNWETGRLRTLEHTSKARQVVCLSLELFQKTNTFRLRLFSTILLGP